MPDFILTTSGKPWIENFRDEKRAHKAVARRGHRLTKIVLATAEAREQFEREKTEFEREETEREREAELRRQEAERERAREHARAEAEAREAAAEVREAAVEAREKYKESLRNKIEKAHETGDWSRIPTEGIAAYAAETVLTTAFTVAGREIEREIEVISAECVYGMNMFRDFFAAVRDVFGGRSAATQKVLRDARKTCLTELRREALMVGADAVIGVNLAYSEFSGKGKSMLFLVASGTAVKLKPRER